MPLPHSIPTIGVLIVLLSVSPAGEAVGVQLPAVVAREQAVQVAAPLTYREALERARAFSPLRASRELQLQAVDALERQAGRRPNPGLDLELENFAGSLPGFKRSETTIFLSQQFETGGKRGARRRLARAGEPLARAGQDEFELVLARSVSLAFAEGLAAQERLALRRELLALADEVVETAEQKVTLGAVLRAEATRSRVTRNLAAVELEASVRELVLARQGLARLFGGTSADVGLFSGTLDTLRTLPGIVPIDTLIATHPALRRLRAEAGVARAELELQQSLASQDFALGAGFRMLDGADDGAFLIGLSTTIPISDRNRGGIAAARIATEQAGLADRAAVNELTGEVERTLGQMAIAQSAVRGLRQDVLPTARQSYDEVETAYRQGRLTYLDLLDARRSLAEARLMEIDWLARLFALRAELEWTLGRALPAIWEGSR